MVSSNVGEGSNFEIYLSVDTNCVSEDSEPVDYSASLKSGRILLADDEPVLIDLGKKILEQAGYSVIAETESENALALFSNRPGEECTKSVAVATFA